MYKSNKFCDILEITNGITCIIGSGGKTSLMLRLAEELGERSRVIIGTTTHIYKPEGVPIAYSEAQLEEILTDETTRVVCVGDEAEDPCKLKIPDMDFGRLKAKAEYLILEGDGSKKLPLKCHAEYEPVIPEGITTTVLVIGLSGIGKKVKDSVHRYELFTEYTGLGSEDSVTAVSLAVAVRSEIHRFEKCGFKIFLNQDDLFIEHKSGESPISETAELISEEIRRHTGYDAHSLRIFAGSIQKGYISEIL